MNYKSGNFRLIQSLKVKVILKDFLLMNCKIIVKFASFIQMAKNSAKAMKPASLSGFIIKRFSNNVKNENLIIFSLLIYFSTTLHYQANLKLFQLNFKSQICHENHHYTTPMYHSLWAPTLNRGFIWIPNPFPFLFFFQRCVGLKARTQKLMVKLPTHLAER